MKVFLFLLPILILCQMSLWIVSPANTTFNLSFLIFIISLLSFFMISRYKEILQLLRNKSTKYFFSLGFNVFLVLSITAILNHLSYKHFVEIDMTREKKNTLADQTKKILEIVKAPMKIELFARREEWPPMLGLIELYRSQNKFITIEAFDTETRLDLVKKYDIKQNGTIRIDYEGRSETSLLIDELSLTNSILRLVKKEKKNVYFLTGHNELSCGDTSGNGISYLCEKLQKENYLIHQLNLIENPNLPKDASTLIIAGPELNFLDQEIESLKNYLENKGSLFLAVSPDLKRRIDPKLAELVKQYGILIGDHFVIDRLSTIQGSEATQPVVDKYEKHSVVLGFQHRTIFPLPLSLRPASDSHVSMIASTSDFPGSWAESDFNQLAKGQAKFDENKDIKGPIGLFLLKENEINQAEKQRIGVVATKYFLTNSFQAQSGNGILFLNTINWLANDDDIISFNRPVVEELPVILSAQHLQIIFLIAIIFVPLVFFLVAIIIYRRRKFE